MGKKARAKSPFSAELWGKNLAALKARPAGCDCLPPLPPVVPPLQRVRWLPGDLPSLQFLQEDGKGVTLHSPRRPWEEARELARNAPVHRSIWLVALGLGLGYHLLALLPSLRPEHHLIVVEQEPEVFYAAMAAQDLTGLFTRDRTILVVHPEATAVVRRVRKLLPQGNGDQWTFWGHPPSLRAGRGFYEKVIAGLRSPSPRFSRLLGLRREHLRVLLINPDYFLIPEVIRAFGQLGHEARLVRFHKRQEPGEQVLRRILTEIREFPPDLVFTVNHLGFDREGLLLEALHRLRVPSVSWYVDSPSLILSLYEGPKSDLAFIFVWDPTYLPEVRALGFERVFTLPLATDPDIFSPARGGFTGTWRQPLAFVGNSMVGSLNQKLARLPATPEFQKLYNRLLQAFMARPFRSLKDLLVCEGLTAHPLLRSLDREGRSDLEAALLWQATLEYRRTCVAALAEFRPVIYGDPDWRLLLGKPFRLRPEVNYYDDLPQIYAATAINFNATSLQMRGAVNQRVFDAPAAGGFVLTDFREQLAELFHLEEEVAYFSDPEEIPDLVRFYLKRPQLRQRLTARARERILAEHTYRHRVAAMLDLVRRNL